jgi:hypothetical protein
MGVPFRATDTLPVKGIQFYRAAPFGSVIAD